MHLGLKRLLPLLRAAEGQNTEVARRFLLANRAFLQCSPIDLPEVSDLEGRRHFFAYRFLQREGTVQVLIIGL